MKIFITGNLGYVGSVLTQYLKKSIPDIKIIGYDAGFYSHSLTNIDFMPEHGISAQYFGDIRDIEQSMLQDIDAVIHLAGISNDPIGKEFENVTGKINRDASIRLVKMAIKEKVKNFVFASSCSMYGNSNEGSRKENDITNPLTAYARSKIGVEEDLKNLDLDNLIFTSLRFATACGWSDRLRLDLVLNDFVACAITSGEITVLSDGTPWRPLIDVEDMCRAINWAMIRKKNNGGDYLLINAGKNSNNYQVKQIANAVAELVPGTNISINKNAPPDKRSYRVDFSMYEKLAPDFQPSVSLHESISRLKNGLLRINFNIKNFRDSSYYMRLNTLKKHIKNNRLSKDLRWELF